MRREILIESVTPETRIAVLEDDDLAELFVERPSSRSVAGNIYKGRVSHVLPGMHAAFVDIGIDRDAFLYVEDAGSRVDAERLEEADTGEEDPGEAAAGGAPLSPPLIEDLLQEGQEIVVQVRKDPVAEKGARLTSHLSLPGRFLVYLPGIGHVGVSRKIEDLAERERLKGLVRDLAGDLGVPGGFIVRTAGEGRAVSEFPADARYLVGAWEEIRRRSASVPTPALLHEEAGAVIKVLRDLLNHDVQQVLVDGETIYREAVAFVDRIEPALLPKIRRHTGRQPLFEERGLQGEIERSLKPRVWLRSGGSIVINPTEALVAVDVNTGKYVGRKRLEETILRTNLEAAVEIVRQVRLRDLGGIIVIDFIDMAEQASKDEVVRALQGEMLKDRAKSRMLQISEFGLVEITRQRTRRSLERILCRPCPACSGSGRLKSPETILWEILRQVRRLGPVREGARVTARVHPDVAACLGGEQEGLLRGVAPPAWPPLLVLPDPALRHEQFALTVQEPA
ncbi:MAG: Rne/Rng family ribonuclease [Acidobacteriota bacterium]